MRSIRAGQVIAAGQYYVISVIGRNGAPVRSNGFNRPMQHLDLSARGNHFAPMPASAIAHATAAWESSLSASSRFCTFLRDISVLTSDIPHPRGLLSMDLVPARMPSL